MDRVKFTASNNTLVPSNDEARAVMARLKNGEHVALEIYRERSTVFNRAHAVFERIARARSHWTMRNVRGWLAAATGRADFVEMSGVKVLVPWSTGLRDMDATEFTAFWEDAKVVIYREILPRLAKPDRDEISEMMGGDKP